ncbi:MAG: YezD family protein [Opitutus sp.]
MTSSPSTTPPATSDTAPDWIALVRENVQGLRYGAVQLVVHDGRVTQIERTEKSRLPSTRDQVAE